MADLSNLIRQAVADGRYIIGQHANERLRERKIPAWQVLSGVESGKIIQKRTTAKPNPVIELRQQLADGAQVKVVWAWLAFSKVAKLVTVHFFNGEE
jgi:hypothetical protein